MKTVGNKMKAQQGMSGRLNLMIEVVKLVMHKLKGLQTIHSESSSGLGFILYFWSHEHFTKELQTTKNRQPQKPHNPNQPRKAFFSFSQ
jgi:hypothetical protein